MVTIIKRVIKRSKQRIPLFIMLTIYWLMIWMLHPMKNADNIKWLWSLRTLYVLLAAGSYLLALLLSDNLKKNFILFAVYASVLIILHIMPHRIDESAHLIKAFSLADGQVLFSMENGESGVYLPDNYLEYAADFRDVSLKTLIMNREYASQPFSDTKTFYATEFMNSYPFFSYLPAALGIALFRLFRVPAVFVLWGAAL